MSGNECKTNTRNAGETVEEFPKVIHKVNNTEQFDLRSRLQKSFNQSALDEIFTNWSDNERINEIDQAPKIIRMLSYFKKDSHLPFLSDLTEDLSSVIQDVCNTIRITISFINESPSDFISRKLSLIKELSSYIKRVYSTIRIAISFMSRELSLFENFWTEEKDHDETISDDFNSLCPLLVRKRGAVISIDLLLRTILSIIFTTLILELVVPPSPISMEDVKKMNELLCNYSPLLVLNLYTQTKCFFRVINQILRQKNYDYIEKYRHVILDLIKYLFHNSLSKIDQGSLTVYRGQQMSIFEVAKLQNHVGELVSTRSFLSTTLNQDVAKIFAGQGCNEKTYEVSVLFEISVDTSQSMRPYALIRNSAEEEEVLFSPDTAFVLVSCRKLHKNGTLWYFKLNAVPEQQEQQSKQSNGETFSTSNEVNKTWDVRSVVIVRYKVT